MPIFTTFNWMTLKSHVKTKKTEKTCFLGVLHQAPSMSTCRLLRGHPGASPRRWSLDKTEARIIPKSTISSFSQSFILPDGMDGTFPPQKFQTQFPLKDWNGSKVKQNKQTSNYPVILRILGYEQQRFWYTRFAIDLFLFHSEFEETCHSDWCVSLITVQLEAPRKA